MSAWAAGAFSLDKNNLLLLLDGVGMDVRGHEYSTFEDLKIYMYRVASAVGLSCLEIFGWRGDPDRAHTAARDLALDFIGAKAAFQQWPARMLLLGGASARAGRLV